jgi:type VI secretion system protein VasI
VSGVRHALVHLPTTHLSHADFEESRKAFGEYGSTSGITARVRYDNEKAQTMSFDRSTDNKGAFFGQPIGAIRKMMQHKKLAFEYSVFQGRKRELIFDLRGLPQAVRPLQKACRWQ